MWLLNSLQDGGRWETSHIVHRSQPATFCLSRKAPPPRRLERSDLSMFFDPFRRANKRAVGVGAGVQSQESSSSSNQSPGISTSASLWLTGNQWPTSTPVRSNFHVFHCLLHHNRLCGHGSITHACMHVAPTGHDDAQARPTYLALPVGCHSMFPSARSPNTNQLLLQHVRHIPPRGACAAARLNDVFFAIHHQHYPATAGHFVILSLLVCGFYHLNSLRSVVYLLSWSVPTATYVLDANDRPTAYTTS